MVAPVAPHLSRSLRRPVFLWLIAALGIGLAAQADAAPLPPSAYVEMQEMAPEVVEIEVLKVQREPAEDIDEEMVRVTAVVLKVEKTSADTETGDFLQIAYTIRMREDGRPGRSQVPLLEEGQRTIAFLQSVEGLAHLAPAAGAMSFSRF